MVYIGCCLTLDQVDLINTFIRCVYYYLVLIGTIELLLMRDYIIANIEKNVQCVVKEISYR